ncbi:N-acetylmuramoyl-L-alanine amidase [Patescibacteria group bacterium]|nr:N-acetylmuramoyl-L-alanine amidase [Patescibacteria group bacterium]
MGTKTLRKVTLVLLVFAVMVTGCTEIVVKAEESTKVVTQTPTKSYDVRVSPTKNIFPTNTKVAKPTPTPTATVIETKRVEVPEPTITETPKATELIISPIFEIGENGEVLVFFGDFYRELPLSTEANDMIIPDSIVIHTDGQSGDYPEKWNKMSTFWGLGTTKSVHFAVSQDGISQMLPMGESWVERANGTTEQWNDDGNWVDYDSRSIQIEMGGRNYNYMITGVASPKMVEVIEITTTKTIDLVVSLMLVYDIPYENIVGHYQIGRGKPDPGNLYFEQYFLPQLEKELEKFQP